MSFARTTTTTLLLTSLRDADSAAAWTAFDARYRPIIEGLAMHMGLPPEDAADVAQQTMLQFLASYRAGGYQRDRGRLRAWLIGIARHRALHALHAAARRPLNAEHLSQTPDSAPESADLEKVWDSHQSIAIATAAMEELREKTRTSNDNIEAFELLVLRGMAPEGVAAACGMTITNVYLIKSRLTTKLREIMTQIAEAYDNDTTPE